MPYRSSPSSYKLGDYWKKPPFLIVYFPPYPENDYPYEMFGLFDVSFLTRLRLGGGKYIGHYSTLERAMDAAEKLRKERKSK